MSSKKDKLVCRTCLKVITDDTELCANAGTYTNFGKVIDILETCVSELNSDLTDEIVLCCHCFTMLGIAYDFKLKCINTEERIFAYMQDHDLSMTDKIHLTDVIQEVDNIDVEIRETKEQTDLRTRNVYKENYNLSSDSLPHVTLDVEDIIRRGRTSRQVNNIFGNAFCTLTNTSSPNLNKSDEYSVVMFDDVPLLSTKTDDLMLKSIEADCNMILDNRRLNQTNEEYFDERFDSVGMDEYICCNDLERIL